MGIFKTTIQFIEDAKLIHGNKYDYSKVIYEHSKKKLQIFCKFHGLFEQIPSDHLSGNGCKKCGIDNYIKKRTSNTEMFITKAKLIHGEKYDYSKTVYVKSKSKVQILCNFHKVCFEQLPSVHLSGAGCKKCSIIIITQKNSSNITEFIKEAKIVHVDKYDYSKVIYENSKKKLQIFCKFHEEYFEQSADSHLQGGGCTKCSIDFRKKILSSNTDDFISKSIQIHGMDIYDYSNVIYINAIIKVSIMCKIHGIFEQSPNVHLYGRGCPSCINKTEGKMYNILKMIYSTIIRQFKNEWCKNIRFLPFDFCIPELKIIIELDGGQHFKQVSTWTSPEEQFENDKFKEKCANENGYSMIRILQEDVFNDKYDWCKELCEEIENIKKENKVVNRYLCKNGEYDKYI